MAVRGVAHVALPADVQEQKLEADKASPRHKVYPFLSFGRSLTLPQDDALAKAAELLNAGSCRYKVDLGGSGPAPHE